ncbi:cardiotrophin-2 [Amia ocellicauda]|uniref:cardiotrophin-2 n=1 Tax=Amia ocellicauda TaxID=2972642 RepID=UPI0034641361
MSCTWRVLLSLCLLSMACPEPLQQQGETFATSLRFSRKILTRVRNLLFQYKEQLMGDSQFEDRLTMLRSLPVLGVGYSQWRSMEDKDRLTAAAQDLKVFWDHLDVKRIQLKEESKRQSSTVVTAMQNIQMDLRDLIAQVHSQLQAMNATVPAPREEEIPSSLMVPTLEWHSKLMGYIILRDLDRYMNKVVRDYILLKVKYRE